MLDFPGTNDRIKVEVFRDEIIDLYKSLTASIKTIEGWLHEI